MFLQKYTFIAGEELGHKCHCIEPDFTNATAPPPIVTIGPNQTYTYEQKSMFDTFNYSILVAKDCITVEDKQVFC